MLNRFIKVNDVGTFSGVFPDLIFFSCAKYLTLTHQWSDAMNEKNQKEKTSPATFGKRKVKPRVCIAETKQHVLTLLGDTLEEQGFVTSQCTALDELDLSLGEVMPDLVVVTSSTSGLQARHILHVLHARAFTGKILLIGARAAPATVAIHDLGERLGLSMLPLLATPFRDKDLHNAVAELIPSQPPPPPSVDVAEALSAGWLELWYQPKIDTRSLAPSGAEALIRMRHPTWGIVPPAHFIPEAGDPHFRALSEFVIGRVFDDWRYFVTSCGHVPLSINLPLSFFLESDSIGSLSLKSPDHPAFEGFTVEVDSTEVVHNLPLAVESAKQLRFHNIGFSIDDVGEEWPSLVAMNEFPFSEVKLDRNFVDGSSSTRLKHSVCRQIVDMANDYGVKTVAEGVETKDDFLAMHKIGVDFIQGIPVRKADDRA